MPIPRLYLLDGSGLCYRAYYAIPGLSTSYGQPTGAVFGFVNILNKILKEKPEYLACCFDVSRDTFRQKRYKEYKSQRPGMPDGLSAQMQLIRDVLASYRVAVCQKQGYEADDLIASLARQAEGKGLETVIVSSDKDILQLVGDKIRVFDPKKDKTGVLYDRKEVEFRYGVGPDRLIDVFSLTGDPVDNIPGASGVGEKTAVSLIKEFGSLSNLLDNLDKVKSASLREAIRGSRENIRLSYDLFRLEEQVEMGLDLEALRFKEPDYPGLFGLFKKLEFNSLLKNLPHQKEENMPAGDVNLTILDNPEKRKEVFTRIRRKGELFFALEDNKAFFLDLQDQQAVYCLEAQNKELSAVLADSGIRKIGHNFKDLIIRLASSGIDLNGLYFDTRLAAYVVDSSFPKFDLDELAFKYLGRQYLLKPLRPQDSLSIVRMLYPLLKERIEKDSLESLLYDVETPLCRVLAVMQLSGVRLDTAVLKGLSGELEARLIKLIDEIYSLNSNQEFNINSPRQLAVVLFERLGLSPLKKTKTGFSTDEEVLRKLSLKHRLPLLILEYRQLTKLKNTYIDSLPGLVDQRTGRLHASFDQAGAETGRLSSRNPNLQNIPAKGEIAAGIRRAFLADEGSFLVSADYSQIELRVLAHFSQDETLVRAFNNNLDIHRHTAGLIFQVEPDKVSPQMRDTAKRINFGIIYGMASFGLAKDLDIPQQEAEGFIQDYFLRYPGVKRFIEAQIESARKLGYVKTLLGRPRYLAAINNQNAALRSFAERQAVNSPIQGTAADIIKLAMVNIHRAIEEKRLKSKMIMQIHDELVFEVPADEMDIMVSLVRDKMENVYRLNVPLKVNIKKGHNWQDMEEVL